ncbi:hypothetical protein [Candidatus Cyanaurora vandensis]|uniref:hypothetical protein n=1 Tax=Candidatus Cyanaurora vandensis TaxID=2714958 RepID=UPI00257B9A31|nr:hypothetical protein [Candidatus Cyanaurora vandensis]
MVKTFSWQLKDYVFAAFMAMGILLAAVVTQPIAQIIPIPGIRTILWAPLAGIFLTLGMARLQRPGTVFLILGPVGLILGLINPIITLVLLVPALVTELVMALVAGYGSRTRRFWGNLIYFEATVLGGVLGTVTGLTAAFGINVPVLNPWLLLPAGSVAGLVAGLGWWLGERVVAQLQKAGKLDIG